MSEKITYEFDREQTIDSIIYIMKELLNDNGIEQLCVAIVGIIDKQPNRNG